MQEFTKVMKALSDPNRVKIVKMLQHRVLCVCEIRAALGLAQSTASKHLKVLESAGLIERRVEGRIHRLFAVLDPLRQAEEWLGQRRAFWEHQLESLRDFVDGPTPSSDPSSESDS